MKLFLFSFKNQMVQRVTYRRRHCYNTKSNKFRLVRTPGGQQNVQYIKKKAGRPKCGECKNYLAGVLAARNRDASHGPRHHFKVSRAYGGNMCAPCVRSRILRAFLLEEQKIVNELIESEIEALNGQSEDVLRRTRTKLLKIKRLLDEEAKKLNNTKANLIQYISALNEKLD